MKTLLALVAFVALATVAMSAPLLPGTPVVVNLDTSETFTTIQAGIDDADTLDGHTLEMLVADHTTPEVQIVFSKSLTLQGGSPDTLRPSSDTGTSGDARGWFLVPLGRTVGFRDLVFDGSGSKIWTAIRNHGTLTVADCEFTEIKYNESGPHYSGIGIQHFATGGAPMTVTDCSFSEIGRIGLHVFEPATVERCTYTGKGVGDWLDYFADVDSLGASLGVATFDACSVSGNRGVASSDGSGSAGMLITTFFGAGTDATITGSSFTDNTVGVSVGFNALDTSDVSISGSIIAGNDFGVVDTSGSTIAEAFGNWWGDASGPTDPTGAFEADNPPCVSASFTPPLDVRNVDGTGDTVNNSNVDYCPWLLVAPPCLSVPAAEHCGVLTASLEGPDLADANNIVVVHYNAGVTPGTADISNVAFIEVRSAQFASSQTLPDPENYALSVVLPAPTSDATNLPPSLLTLDAALGGIGEPAFGGIPAVWTVDYYSGANTPGDLVGARTHTVLYGASPDGVCDLVQTFASPTEQFAQTVFHITDGIYHSVVDPEVDITTATIWDGSGFTIPVPGLSVLQPHLYGESRSIDIGNSSDAALLTGTADPGFVTVWVTDFCTRDTLSQVATNVLSLDIVDLQDCYQEDDLITIELNMTCLEQTVTGFFASVTYDPTMLALQPASTYTISPFPLHILDPIVDTGAPPGTLLLDGSSAFGASGTTADALLASLVFEVLPGNDGVSTAVAFTTGGSFANELSFEGDPVPTRFGNPLDFHVDQAPPSILCGADIAVDTDLGECSASVVVTPPAAADACGLLSLEGVRSDALPLDDPYPAGCAPGADTFITWTATDCAGHESVCVQTVSVTDAEDPALADVPADIEVVAEAGGCSAIVTYDDPTATDNCDASPVVVCTPPSGSSFPTGLTIVTCTATDDCGNQSMATFDVTVLGTNEVDVEVELVGVSVPTVRCIRFVGSTCDAIADVPLAFTDHDSSPVTPVRAVATIEIPCGAHTALCAKDQQHTEWDTSPLMIVGTKFVATTLLSLEGGDTDDDGDCDINDVTLFIVQFGDLTSPGGCPWDGTTRDADFSTNGAIGSEDYSFLVANFLTLTDCACTAPLSTGGRTGGVPDVSLPVDRVPLAMRGQVDLSRDGIVDHRDVRLFELEHGLPHDLSERMQLAEVIDRR